MASAPARRKRETRTPVPERRRRRRGKPRALVAGLALLGIAAAVVAWWLVTTGSTAQGPIIIISIDTLRADRLPVYGYSQGSAPAIAALAADGVLFERAYSHSPQTLPSHTSIFTGRLPFEHGVRDNVGFTVPPGTRLLAAMLKERGYSTAGFGSAFVLRKDSGIADGFETYDSEIIPKTIEASMGAVQRDGAETLTLAERWLDGREPSRFFLFVHFYEPHKPYRPPERYAQYPSRYDGEVAYADELVGRLIRYLQERRLYDPATIILLSDHGEGLGDHGEEEHGVLLYDESLRVPLIVKLPRGQDAGRRVSTPVQHIDLLPTVLDLIGAPAPAGLRGSSLKQALRGNLAGLADRGIYSETLYPRYHFGWSELFALTDSRFRFISAPKPELYDLERDPDERRNLRDERAQTTVSMEAALRTFIDAGSIEKPKAVSDEDLEKFQALGYLGVQSEVAARPSTGLIDPKDKIQVLELYRQGLQLRSERRFAESAEVFRKILADDPGMLDIWSQLGQTLMRMGRTADAVEALKHAVELRPEATETLIAIAEAQLRLGQFEESEKHAELARAKSPAQAHQVLARVALARGDKSRALEEAKLAQAADSSLPIPLYIQGLALYNERRYAEALPFFQEALGQLRPRNLALRDLHFHTADALAQLERYPEAEQEFKEELRRFPENSAARANLALLYHVQGRPQEANRALAELVATTPTPESYALAVRTFGIVGDSGNAQAMLVRGLRDFPNSAELRAMVRQQP